MKALNLANGSTSNKRRELDFYPTPPDVTHALMRFLHRHGIQERMQVWEPACGDGAMAKVIAEYGHDVYASDIRETGYGDGGIDFLNFRGSEYLRGFNAPECDCVITNPPFNLSEQFIRAAIEQAGRTHGTVAMLLKSQYWHAAKRKALFEEHPPAWVLPLSWRPDFMGGERGGAPTMEVHWTVWQGGDTNTKYRILGRGV